MSYWIKDSRNKGTKRKNSWKIFEKRDYCITNHVIGMSKKLGWINKMDKILNQM